MKMVFADTYFFLATTIKNDVDHEKAIAVAETISVPIVTTAWVLTEVVDALSHHSNRTQFQHILFRLEKDPFCSIVPPSETLFERAVNLYTDRPDKNWSLTDCTSFIVMADRGMTDALTADHHFTQAGFHCLLD